MTETADTVTHILYSGWTVLLGGIVTGLMLLIGWWSNRGNSR